MKIWEIFGKKAQIAPATTTQDVTKYKDVRELTAEEGAWIEDLAKDGLKSAEIAENLKLDIRTIYNYRKIINEREKNKPAIDPQVAAADLKKQTIENIKDNMQIQKLQLECDAQIQKMQLDRLQFEKELREWKDELGETPGSSDQMSLVDLITLLNTMQPGGQAPANVATLPPQAHIQQVTSKAPEAAEDKAPPDVIESVAEEIPEVEMSDDQIREFIKTYDKKMIKTAKLLPDQLIADKIVQQLPTLSEKSINRGIEILRSEF